MGNKTAMRLSASIMFALAVAFFSGGFLMSAPSQQDATLPAEKGFFRSPELTIPKAGNEFKIDGELSETERKACAELSTFFTFEKAARADDRMAVYLAHTGKQLYVGFKIRRMQGGPLKAKAEKKDDMQLWKGDDALEMRLFTDVDGFNFIGNSTGVGGDAKVGKGDKGTDVPWNHEGWRYAAKQTDEGWQGEFLIDAAALGMKEFEAGKQVLIDFLNNAKSESMIAGWAYQAGLSKVSYDKFPRLIFGDADSIYQAGQKLGVLGEQRIGLLAELKNPSKSEQKLKVWAGFYRVKEGKEARNFFVQLDGVLNPDGIEILPGATYAELLAFALKDIFSSYVCAEKIDEVQSIPGGGTQSISLKKPDLAGDYLVAWQLIDERKGLPVTAGVYPFSVSPPLHTDFEYYYLSAEQLIVRTSISEDIAHRANAIQYEVLRGDQKIAEKTVGEFKGGEILETVFPTGDWPAGEYSMIARAMDGKTVVSENRVPFKKPETPFWWKSDAGKQIKVSWPWTPVEASKSSASVWGRTMEWGNGVVPEKITSQQKELLTAPPRVTAKVDGKTGELTWDSFALESQQPDAAVYRGVARLGNLRLEAKTTIEFDGMARFDWTLSGAEGKPARVEELFLELPVAKSVAELLAVENDSRRYDVSGRMPEKELALDFTSSVVIRNSHVGLEWFAECQQYWSNQDESRLIEILPGKEAVTLRVRFVDKPVNFDSPRTITWGLIAWPVKPWPKQAFNLTNYLGTPSVKKDGWDDWKDGIPMAKKYGANIIEYFHWNGLDQTPDYPVFYNDKIRKRVEDVAKIADQNGVPIIGHTGYALPTDTEDFENFGMEMVNQPLKSHGSYGYAFTATPVYIDAYVSRYKKLAEETGWSGLQSDGGLTVRGSENERIGMGWRDEKGRLRERFPIFAFRELSRRLYNVFHGEVPFPTLPNGNGHITLHCYYPFGAVQGFVDSLHLGESRRTWGELQVLNRDMERAIYDPRALGVPMLCLPKLDKVQHGGRGRIAFALMFQMNPAGNRLLNYVDKENYDKKSYPVHRVWAAQDWIGAEPEIFHGFWENQDLISFDKEDFFASIHLRPGEKALVAVINWKPEDRDVTASLNLKEMNLAGGEIVIEDAITGESISAPNGQVKLNVGGDGYRLLKIWRK